MSSDNKGPYMTTVLWSLTCIAGTFLGLRIYCKRRRGTGLWWDDHLMVVAWITLVISVTLNTHITALGFGRHLSTISDENRKTIQMETIFVATFAILATGLSKTSFVVTLYRLYSSWWMRAFLIFVAVTINISLNTIWIFGLLKCSPLAKVFDPSVPGTCWDKKKLTDWDLFASFYSSIMDFVLAFVPWKMLLGMNMGLREKVGVTVAMSMGVIAGATGIVKSVLVQNLTDPDVTYDRVELTIWTLTEPAVTIMAASLPVLRMLYRELRSSQRSYFENRSQRYGQTNKTQTNRRQSNVHGPQRKRNVPSAMLSMTGWQDSQEALQYIDMEGGHVTVEGGHVTVEGGQIPPHAGNGEKGIRKTEEVRVQHAPRECSSTIDSFEMDSIEGTKR